MRRSRGLGLGQRPEGAVDLGKVGQDVVVGFGLDFRLGQDIFQDGDEDRVAENANAQIRARAELLAGEEVGASVAQGEESGGLRK